MTTRRKSTEPGQAISQERFMSAPEYAELRGISGVAVAPRVAALQDPELRSLLWFIQGKSLEQGGVRKIADELLERFETRISDMDRARHGRPGDLWGNRCRCSLADFLIELCINPSVRFDVDRDWDRSRTDETTGARLSYFKDVMKAIATWKRELERAPDAQFQQTAISRKMWQAFDRCLKRRRMVMIDGLEGRGKTEAATAWCRCRLGQARYVSLQGVTSKTSAFREIAKALGVASSYTRTATEMQARIEDVLQRSQLMLVVDEAHFAFNQSQRIYTRPELIDWFDTALHNHAVPLALVTTPQFLICMSRAADQVGWNYRQFQRRVLLVKLPGKNTRADLFRVAEHVLGLAGKNAVEYAVGYAQQTGRDLSAIGDISVEAAFLADEDGRGTITYTDVEKAIDDVLTPSDNAFAAAFPKTKSPGGKGKGSKGSGTSDSDQEPANPGNIADTVTGHDRVSNQLAASAKRPQRNGRAKGRGDVNPRRGGSIALFSEKG